MRPRVGDRIVAGLDFGVHFRGVVTKDDSNNPYFPHYIADGTVHLSNMWEGGNRKRGNRRYYSGE